MSIFRDVMDFIKSTCRCCVRYMDDEPPRPNSPASVTIIDQGEQRELHFNHSISIVVHGDVRVLHHHHNYAQTPPPSPRAFIEELSATTSPSLIGTLDESKMDI